VLTGDRIDLALDSKEVRVERAADGCAPSSQGREGVP